MKRIVSVLMIAVLLLALAGCGGKENVVKKLAGEWTYRMDISEKLTESLMDSDPTMAEYFDFRNLTMALNYRVGEDGAFEMAVDGDSAREAYDMTCATLHQGMEKYFTDALETAAATASMTMEDICELYGVSSAQEVMEISMGMSVDEIIETLMPKAVFLGMFTDIQGSGTVSAKGNDLTFTYSDGAEDHGTYDPEHDTVTLNVTIEELGIQDCVFTRK